MFIVLNLFTQLIHGKSGVIDIFLSLFSPSVRRTHGQLIKLKSCHPSMLTDIYFFLDLFFILFFCFFANFFPIISSILSVSNNVDP